MDSVEVQDFTLFKKGEYSFKLPQGVAGRDFMELDLANDTPVVSFSL